MTPHSVPHNRSKPTQNKKGDKGGWLGNLWRSTRASFHYTPKSLELAWRASPEMSLAIAILTLASAALPLGIAYVGKTIIDKVVAHAVDPTAHWVAVELALIAAQALVQRALFLLRGLLGEKLGLDVNVLILEKAIQLELAQFEDSEFYDKLTRARREASSRPVSMVTDSLQLVQNALTLAGYVALLVSFSGWAVLGLVLASLPATVAEMRFSNAAFRMRNWRSPDTRRLNYVEYVLANDSHAKEVKVLGLGPLLLDRYKRFGKLFYEEDKELSTRRSIWAYFLSLLATLAFYGCFFVMAVLAAKGKLSLGNLTLYVVAFRQGQQAFQSCLTAIGNMYESNLYMSNLFEYLAIASLPNAVAAGSATRPQTTAKERGIHFDNVGFCYPGREIWALRNINLDIPEGQSIALVGHNGAGKTTFIKLLCRLYDPSEGCIRLDGRDLREWDREELWRRISVVFQDFNKYQFTFGENVGMGDVPHLEDEARIQRAVKAGGAAEVLSSLSEGTKTPLGRWFLDGVDLSGGQWQKIALSRAFMREQADILILDEPTAALDAEAEYAVFERFQNLAKGRTSILISHRFPTVRLADRIIVVEGGRIVEEGTHPELLAAGGRYSQLFALQAKGYV